MQLFRAIVKPFPVPGSGTAVETNPNHHRIYHKEVARTWEPPSFFKVALRLYDVWPSVTLRTNWLCRAEDETLPKFCIIVASRRRFEPLGSGAILCQLKLNRVGRIPQSFATQLIRRIAILASKQAWWHLAAFPAEIA